MVKRLVSFLTVISAMLSVLIATSASAQTAPTVEDGIMLQNNYYTNNAVGSTYLPCLTGAPGPQGEEQQVQQSPDSQCLSDRSNKYHAGMFWRPVPMAPGSWNGTWQTGAAMLQWQDNPYACMGIQRGSKAQIGANVVVTKCNHLDPNQDWIVYYVANNTLSDYKLVKSYPTLTRTTPLCLTSVPNTVPSRLVGDVPPVIGRLLDCTNKLTQQQYHT